MTQQPLNTTLIPRTRSYAGTGKSNIMQVKTAPGRQMSKAEIQAFEQKQRDYLNA